MEQNKIRTLDALERPLRDLRISVTDRCNFRCRYCMPEEIFGNDFPFLKNEQLLSFEEITLLAEVFVALGVEKIRLSGGEPLLRPGLPVLIRSLKEIVSDVALTTNGSLLAKQAKELKEAGLDRINVSLDTLDESRFRMMNGNRCSVDTVLQGIEAAAKAGLKVKVNMVVQKGKNDQDIVSMARHFRGTGHILRFIEFMDVGNSNGWDLEQVVSKQEIVRRIHEEMPLIPIEANYKGEVASRFRYQDSIEEIGVVSSVTETFCGTCNRARLSANGHLYTCLFAVQGTDLQTLIRSGASKEEVKARIASIWGDRNDRYSEERFTLVKDPEKKKIEMHYIGG